MILLGIAIYQFHDFKFDLLVGLFEHFESEQLAEFFEHFKTSLFVAIKVITISVLIMLTSPTSTHALMEAGYDDGVKPITGDDDRDDSDVQDDDFTTV